MFFFRRKHPISDDELNAYVDDQLSADARDRLDVHVEACAACRETLVELRSVRQALHDLPRETAPRSFALRQADVEAPARARPAGAFAGAPSLLGALATVSIVAFVALVAVDAGGTPTGGSGDGVPAGFAPMASEEDEDGSGERLSDDEAQTLEFADELAAGSDIDGSGPADADEPTNRASIGDVGDGEEGTDTFDDGAQREPGEEFAPGSGDGAAAPEPATPGQDNDGGPSRLRVAEAAAAAVALLAGGSFALVWWRRRA